MQSKELQPITEREEITLDDIRKYYFYHTKRTLQVEDAKYLLERSIDLGINNNNGGLQALFSTLKYRLE
ncbi:MAG: hypothetical protein RIC15_09585 [Vicingaceae bacterium]